MENFETLFKWAQTDLLTKNRVKNFRQYFGNLEQAWKFCNRNNLIKAGLRPEHTDSFIKCINKVNIQKAHQDFIKSQAKLIFFEDQDYPYSLGEIAGAPIFLYILGDLEPTDQNAFAVVGSRIITSQGRQIINDFIPSLIKAGFTIISGLAHGVDKSAHQETLKSKGRTIGILGSGIDNIWPRENRKLAKQIIAENGAIISEFPLGTPPLNTNFPRRNRIISGMSRGVLVVEGKEKSGSLITAKIALNQNKEVFAIPGSPYSPLAKGPNSLIQKGEAKLTQIPEDILNEFNLQTAINFPRQPPDNPDQKKILYLLSNQPTSFDEIVIQADMQSAEVLSILTILEMKSYATNIGMNQWIAC